MGDEMAVDCPQAACGAALLRHLRARPSAVAVAMAQRMCRDGVMDAHFDISRNCAVRSASRYYLLYVTLGIINPP